MSKYRQNIQSVLCNALIVKSVYNELMKKQNFLIYLRGYRDNGWY
jgi:hypothetical protein